MGNYYQKLGFFLFFLTGLFLFYWTFPSDPVRGTKKIWDRNGILLYEEAGSVGHREPVTFSQIPKNLIDATIVAEDASYWQNPGVDFKAILRALYLNIRYGKIISGASTITQQLARTYFEPEANFRFIRKVREILTALRLNATKNKKDILALYLSRIYYGNELYGIGSAARFYFHKNVVKLSLAESALLAGVVANPSERDPFKNRSEAIKQQKKILDAMVFHKMITAGDAEEAKNEPLVFYTVFSEIKAPHFVDLVKLQYKDMNIKSDQGVNIYTTLDYYLYTLSLEIAQNTVEKLKLEHDLSNASLVLLDNKSGAVLDMLGGVDYFNASNSGQMNLAVANRQPGSALKPITYASAFEKGYTPATLLFDIKQVFMTKNGEGFTPYNYDGKFHGPVLVRESLASSLNVPAVEILNKIGVDTLIKTSKDMGIKTLNEIRRYDLSLTLGGGEVRLVDLVNSYATLARGGLYKEWYVINKITDDTGKTIFVQKNSEGKQVLGKNGKSIAYLISDILADSKARILGFGEKNPLVLSHPAAVKTGTTTDWHDNWTIGYTPSFTVGVWVGNNDNHPMREITGVVGAAPIWNQFFEEFLKGKRKEKFSRPENIQEAEICKLSGKLYDGICPEKVNELFIRGTEPKEVSSPYYPPELYSWAVENQQNNKTDPKEETFLAITYPREKAVFETAPDMVKNESIVFEAGVSSNIAKVLWYVDSKLISESVTFPFSAKWLPVVGKHTIKAIGQTEKGEKITSNEVNIRVLDYKNNY